MSKWVIDPLGASRGETSSIGSRDSRAGTLGNARIATQGAIDVNVALARPTIAILTSRTLVRVSCADTGATPPILL
jgi:hypothetical protein